MTGFKEIIFALLFGGLFAFALISGGIRLAETNNVNQSLGDDPAISDYSDALNTALTESYESANSSEGALSSSPVTLTSGFLIFDAIGGIWKILKVIPVTMWNLTAGIVLNKIFGGNTTAFYVVFSVLGAFLIISIIFAVWRMVATGESE